MQAFFLTLFTIAALSIGGCSSDDLTKNDLPVQCLDKPEPGPCKARVIRYFYDYRYDRCRAFHYGGCKGRVPFKTLETCEEICVGGAG
jgi:hypothetical protein